MNKPETFIHKFELLEHTADIYVRSFGRTMQEAYENAALALFETMTDTTKVAQNIEATVEVEAEDQYALLYNWLEAVLVKFETEGILYSKLKIAEWNETDESFKIKAKISGEIFDPRKHVQRVAVKAVTYHRMVIIREPERVVLEFILDI